MKKYELLLISISPHAEWFFFHSRIPKPTNMLVGNGSATSNFTWMDMETVIISLHKSATPEYFKSTLGVKFNIDLKIAAPIVSDISLFPPEKVRPQKDFKNWNFYGVPESTAHSPAPIIWGRRYVPPTNYGGCQIRAGQPSRKNLAPARIFLEPDRKLLPVPSEIGKNIVLAFLKAAWLQIPYWVHFIFKGLKSNIYVHFHVVNETLIGFHFGSETINEKCK